MAANYITSSSEVNLNMLLLGKTGNGKSSTGNSILMKDNTFKTSAMLASETKTAKAGFTDFDAYHIKVVDTPGVADTCLSKQEGYEMINTAAKEAMTLSPDGYHAILIILKFGDKYTNEEHESIKALMKIFGNDFIEKHGILLITNGDKIESENITFEDYMESGKEIEDFKELCDLCKDRIILFNNKLFPNRKDNLEDKKTKEKDLKAQNEKLIDIIVENGLHLSPYIDKHFQAAKELRDEFIINAGLSMFTEEMKKQTAAIFQKIESTKDDPPDEKIKNMKQCLKENEDLQKTLDKASKGTNALSEPKEIVSKMKTIITQKIEQEEKIQSLESNNKEEKEQLEEMVKIKDRKLDKLKTKYGDYKSSYEYNGIFPQIGPAIGFFVMTLLTTACHFSLEVHKRDDKTVVIEGTTTADWKSTIPKVLMTIGIKLIKAVVEKR